VEPSGDLFVAQALAEEIDHLPLPAGQAQLESEAI
jgi:hypothetical protein